MICVLLPFLTMLLSNYRVTWKVELKSRIWRQNNTTFIRNTAILALKEEWLLRSKNISEMNTPSFDSVVFLFSYILYKAYDVLMIPCQLFRLTRLCGKKMLFWAHIIHFPKRIVLHRIINVINSECLFVWGSREMPGPAGLGECLLNWEIHTVGTIASLCYLGGMGEEIQETTLGGKIPIIFSKLPGIGFWTWNLTSFSGSISVVSRIRSAKFILRVWAFGSNWFQVRTLPLTM